LNLFNISCCKHTGTSQEKQISEINKINQKIHPKPECSPSTAVYLDISATHCHQDDTETSNMQLECGGVNVRKLCRLKKTMVVS
jgi:hypothetical protein